MSEGESKWLKELGTNTKLPRKKKYKHNVTETKLKPHGDRQHYIQKRKSKISKGMDTKAVTRLEIMAIDTMRKKLKTRGCGVCPVRQYCERYDVLDDDKRLEGCGDMKQILLENRRAARNPEWMLANTIAELQTKLQFQEMQDGSDEKNVSKEYLQLLAAKKEFLNMVFKYGKGPQKIEVTHKKASDKDFLMVNAESYGNSEKEDKKEKKNDKEKK